MSDGGARGSAFAFTIARPVATTMVTLAVATFGAISFRKIPLELLPEISYPSITVRTEYPGAGPEDIEERVTRHVEEALAVLPGLVSHSSTSRPGVSDVLLEFQWDKSLTLATQEIRERLDRANLPNDSKSPLVLRYDPSLDPVLRIAVSGDLDLSELRVAAEEQIGRLLATVSGVAAVKTRGGLETEIRVRLDNRKLSQLNLDISEVDRKLRIENVNLASGKLIEGDTEYLVRTLNEFRDIEEILDLGIAQRSGQPIRMRDISTVERGAKERDVITRSGGREAVELLVYREADANIVELATEVKRRLFGIPSEIAWLARIAEGAEPDPEVLLAAALARAEADAGTARPASGPAGRVEQPKESAEIQGLRLQVARKKAASDYLTAKLPRGMEARVLSDQAVFIENAIEEVKGAALLGGLLSVLVLLLFLRDGSATSIISVSIPLSVIATFACMFAVDTTLNIMSLGGLALGIGMLVDNSIVVLESIVRCREEGDDRIAGAIRGTQEVGSAVVASTLTTVAVFFPIAFVSGVAGQIFKDQALTVVFSLTSSLFVALYFVPMLAARFGRAQTRALGTRPWRETFATPRRFLGDLLRPVCRPSHLLAVGGLKARLARPTGLVSALRWLLVPVDVVQVILEVASRVALAAIAIPVYAFVGALASVVRGAAFVARPLALAFDRGYQVIANAYPTVLRFVLATPGRIALLLLVSIAAAIAAYGRIDSLGSEMLPPVHQGELIVKLDLRVGTPVEETSATIQPIERAIAAVPGVVAVSSAIGVARDEVAGVDEGSHTAKILVRLATAGQVTPARDRASAEERAIESIRKILSRRAELVGYRFSRPTLFAIDSPLAVEIKADDLERLRSAAAEIERRMAAIPSLADVRSNIGRGNPEVLLTLDRDKMLRFGLDIEAISNRIRAQVQGVVSTHFPEGDRRIDIRVKSDIDTVDELLDLTVNRGRAVDLADTLDRGSEGGGGTTGTGSSRSRDRTFFPGISVDLGSASPIPLRQVAEVKIVEGPAEIRRIGGRRAAVVSASTSGFDVGRAVADLRPAIAAIERDFPDVTCSIGGQGAEMGAALDEMRIVTLLAIFLVYLVMAAQFESVVQPLLIMGSIPLALVGAIAALWLTRTPVSVVALIGAVVLAGIVVNNAIVLVDYANQLRARGMDTLGSLAEAGRARLRPILMTTGTTVLGLLPLTGALELIPGITQLPALLWAGSELQAPLAITVIGGLSLSTLLTLFVIPALYSLTERVRSAIQVEE